ncbi:MAG: bifunctional phosphopantothenoylcysteine decarboxylase/phosphopantothenate--cysteine ligase CoaBC [Candidatus Planktophila sp.]
MQVNSREIILGVGGGIAAYKSCDLLRRLLDLGHHVTVVPTPSSLNFVGKATWEALSGRSVTTEVFESVEEVRHISLAKKSDFIVISPATADLIARLASGRADDLLTNVVLASTSEILLVPAMHPQMWSNSATLANVETLRQRGIHIMEPAVGALTSGDIGKGRLPETHEIIAEIESLLSSANDFAGRKILITAGGTREPIDPVRFIGNRSSGKQGYAIAREAARRGAEVSLIAANSQLAEIDGVEIIHVETAHEMFSAVELRFDDCDALFMSAAVADARPLDASDEKIKKGDYQSIELVENADILKSLLSKKKKQIIVAFAAETSHDRGSALAKLESKGADILYLNDISAGDIFNSETTYGEIFKRDGTSIKVAKTTKDTLARELLDTALIQLG